MPSSNARGATLRLSLSALLSMSLWFSATAVAPALQTEWKLAPGETAWLTMSVQMGFVAGTLLSAFFTIADRVEARTLFAVSSFLGAAANGMLIAAESLWTALPLRFLTGSLLAGVYPPAMKLAASWFRERRGLAVGTLVGALSVGSAAPHLFGFLAVYDGWSALPWEVTVAGASLLALIGGVVVLLGVEEGPYAERIPAFNPSAAGGILRERGLRLANLGYLGHMWELYAMWTWVPAFLLEIFRDRYGPGSAPAAAAASFAVIAAGGPGSYAAGYLADRLGRTGVVIASLAVSGSCCLLAGAAGEASAPAAVGLCLLWGFAVVADSAQYSTMVTELAPPGLVGTALTLQTCLGFLLTTVTLRILPLIRDQWGWDQAFAILALGPAVGIAAMIRLRQIPESNAIALGRK